MKKRVFGILIGVAFLVIGAMSFTPKMVEVSSVLGITFDSVPPPPPPIPLVPEGATVDIPRPIGAEERARAAYCQIFGDRVGCKNDPSRTCSLSIFCS